MLSQETIRIVKSTVPVLEEHGETLTKHFYQRMFTNNPEVKPFFNPANQAEGTQQKALAGAILAYASNIDNLQVLGGAVDLIAHKHASLMITEDQYPIVGENLLGAIKDVLGDAATDDIINAWGEAYGLLAKVLIDEEKKIYKANAEKAGGWQGFRAFKVSEKTPESDIITSFYLKPVDGGALPDFHPGQYITVRMPTPDGSTTMRNYSLSDVPGQPYFRISVKKEDGPDAGGPNGYISHKLHSEVEAGAELEVGPPCGEFVLDPAQASGDPLVLLAGGVGITPILTMAKAALKAQPNRHVVLVHGITDEKAQAFKRPLEELAKSHDNLKLRFRYSVTAPAAASAHSSTGLVDEAFIEALVPQFKGDFYFCGPEAFMATIYQTLQSHAVPASNINFEFFGPKQALEHPVAQPSALGSAS